MIQNVCVGQQQKVDASGWEPMKISAVLHTGATCIDDSIFNHTEALLHYWMTLGLQIPTEYWNASLLCWLWLQWMWRPSSSLLSRFNRDICFSFSILLLGSIVYFEQLQGSRSQKSNAIASTFPFQSLRLFLFFNPIVGQHCLHSTLPEGLHPGLHISAECGAKGRM